MIRQHHLTRGTIAALAAALTASLASAAWADPAPLQNAETTISQSGPAIRPNPDQQPATGATANPGPCSEVCSGDVRSYGSANQRSRTPNGSGATLPHDSRPGSAAIPSLYSTASTPPKAARVITQNGGFHWGDAGIGAGSMLALTLIALGGVVTLTHRRRIHDARAS